MPTSPHMLFVYGSLMSDQASAHLMAGAELIGRARTAPRFTLHRIDWYPGLAEGGATAIHGELYRVPPAVIAELDEYEGPDYRRVDVALTDGPVATAEVYVMAPEAIGEAPVVPSGDWRDR